MALQPGVGTLLSVSASLPLTETQTAYGAITYTPVGKVESVGAGGKSRQEITFIDLESGEEEVFGGSISYGSRSVGIGEVLDDAGQLILEAAFNGNSKVAVEIGRPDGSLRYFTARVMAFNDQGFTANAVIKLEVALRQVTAEIDVEAP